MFIRYFKQLYTHELVYKPSPRSTNSNIFCAALASVSQRQLQILRQRARARARAPVTTQVASCGRADFLTRCRRLRMSVERLASIWRRARTFFFRAPVISRRRLLQASRKRRRRFSSLSASCARARGSRARDANAVRQHASHVQRRRRWRAAGGDGGERRYGPHARAETRALRAPSLLEITKRSRDDGGVGGGGGSSRLARAPRAALRRKGCSSPTADDTAGDEWRRASTLFIPLFCGSSLNRSPVGQRPQAT